MENDLTLFDTQTTVLTDADMASKIDFTRVSVDLVNMPDDLKDTGIQLKFHVENTVVTDGPYSLTYAPPETAISIQKFVLQTLGETDLKQMTAHLVNAASLIDVAYNACNGIDGAFSDMYSLRNEVADVVADSVKTASLFQNTAQRALLLIFQAYKYLCGEHPNPNNAINSFKACATVAGAMANKATELANKFDDTKKSIEKQGTQVSKVEESKIKENDTLKQKIQEIKASIDGLNSSKDYLKQQIDEAKEMYDKYDKEANELQKTANKAEIASIVCKGIGALAEGMGQAFAAYEQSKRPTLNINSSSTIPQQTAKDDNGKETTQTLPADVEQKNKDIGKVKVDMELTEGRIKNNTEKIETLKHELAVVKGTEADDKIIKPYREEKAIQDEIDATQKLADDDNTSFNTLKAQKDEYDAWMTARMANATSESVKDSTDKMGQKLDEQSNTIQQAAYARREAADNLLKLKFDLQKTQTENLKMLAQYATQVKSAQINSVDLTVVINSLRVAVTCLSMTTDIMRQTAVFWSNMSTLCSNLASDRTADTIKNDLELYGIDGIADVYKMDPIFALSMFLLICQWDAVYLICKEYYDASQVANKILSDSQWRAEMDPKDHWDLSKKLAEQIENRLNIQIVDSSQKTDAYKNELETNEKARQEQDAQIQDAVTANLAKT
jgi:hypothetical protein